MYRVMTVFPIVAFSVLNLVKGKVIWNVQFHSYIMYTWLVLHEIVERNCENIFNLVFVYGQDVYAFNIQNPHIAIYEKVEWGANAVDCSYKRYLFFGKIQFLHCFPYCRLARSFVFFDSSAWEAYFTRLGFEIF